MDSFIKIQTSRAMIWAAALCITAMMVFSVAPVAMAQPSPEQIAEARAAAEQGEAWAQYNLGVSYDYGFGVPEDDATAVKWYTKSAEQGYALAQFNLGTMYDKGFGVPEDDATAVKWYTKAAEQGDGDAQNNLATKYAHGEGVPEDNVMAYMWWNLAAAKGNESAKTNKGIVKEQMTSGQIAEAQTLSRQCLANDYKNCG